MSRLPREARDGLMRAWLEILRERHSGITWVPVEQAASEGGSPRHTPAPKQVVEFNARSQVATSTAATAA
jgi:hypothetical protein